MVRLRRHARGSRAAAEPGWGRRLVAALAGALAAVAPVAPATALAVPAKSPGAWAPPAVLVSPDASAGSVVACPSGDTAEDRPAEPVNFRSKKTTLPFLAPTTPPVRAGIGQGTIRVAETGTAASTPVGAYRCSPEERGPPRRTGDEAGALANPGAGV